MAQGPLAADAASGYAVLATKVQVPLTRPGMVARPRLTGPLCDAVTGQAGGQAMLAALEKANLFLTPLDDERRWYRYHHLFAELLRARLSQSGPELGIQQAWALTFAGELDGVESLLEGIEQRLSPDDLSPETQDVLGSIALIRGLMADMRGDVPRAIELALRADNLLPKNDLTPRSIIPFILGRAYRAQGDLEKAESALKGIVSIGRAVDNIWTITVGTGELVTLRETQGRLREAMELCRECLQLAAERGARRYGSLAMIGVSMGGLLLAESRLDDARRYVQEALEQMRGWQSPNDLAMTHAMMARVLLAQGDLGGADAALQEAEQIQRSAQVFPHFQSVIEACRARLWLAQGNLADAARWAQEKVSGDGRPPLRRELEEMAAARVFIAQGAYEQAQALLARLAEAAEAGGRSGRLAEILSLQAVALRGMQAPGMALSALRRALALAEPEDCVQVFVDEGEPMVRLLKELRQQDGARGSLAGYADRLLAAFAGQEHRAEAPAAPALVEPLSGRELEVLRLVALGWSNAEIPRSS